MRVRVIVAAVRVQMGCGEVRQCPEWTRLRAAYRQALRHARAPVIEVPPMLSMAGFCDRVGGYVGRFRVKYLV